MSVSVRSGMIVLSLLAAGQSAWAQADEDRPAFYVPSRPPTRQEVERRESLKAFALGLLCERDDRLPEATQAFEKAARLDPEAAPVFKALIPLYLAMERPKEALDATRKVLDLDPDDFETWFIYARQFRAQGQLKDSRTALARGLKCPGLADRPELSLQMHHDLGQMCESAQEYEQAAAAFAQAAKILEHPDALLETGPYNEEELAHRAAELYERIARDYLQIHKNDEAIQAFRKAQSKFPDGGQRLNYNMALICKDQGKLPEALGYLDSYLRLQPQGTDAYNLKVTLLQRLQRDAEIVPWLEQASGTDHYNVALKLLLASQLVRAHQTERAEKIYQELASQAPTADVYRGLFRLYEEKAGADQALALLDRTLATAGKKQVPTPSDPAPAQARAMIAALRDDAELAGHVVHAALARLDHGELQTETLHFLALLADRNQQAAEAERFYRQCLPSVTPATEGLVYSGLMRVLWKENKFEDIVKLCRDGLQKTKSVSPVLFHSEEARALSRLERVKEALAEADSAIRLAADTDRLNLRLMRIRLLINAERYAAAETECQAMLKDSTQQGDILEIRYVLSYLYSNWHQNAKSEEQLQLILKVDPSNATACNDLGYLWADQGKNLKEAEELIRKALNLDRQQKKNGPPQAGADADKDHAAYVDSLGWVLFRRGQADAALQELQKAAALPEGDDPVIWEHLGDVYQHLQQNDRACESWQRALHLYEQDRRRKMDQRYKDLKNKLNLLDTQ